MQEGNVTADDIDPIKILTSDFIIDNYKELGLKWYMVKNLERGLIFTLDNRRLYAFQQAGMQQIRVKYATRDDIINDKDKFSAIYKDYARQQHNFGTTVRLRKRR